MILSSPRNPRYCRATLIYWSRWSATLSSPFQLHPTTFKLSFNIFGRSDYPPFTALTSSLCITIPLWRYVHQTIVLLANRYNDVTLHTKISAVQEKTLYQVRLLLAAQSLVYSDSRGLTPLVTAEENLWPSPPRSSNLRLLPQLRSSLVWVNRKRTSTLVLWRNNSHLLLGTVTFVLRRSTHASDKT